ncbi:MAG: hypothetical protein AAF805_11695 [Planctomycetota bacterium]
MDRNNRRTLSIEALEDRRVLATLIVNTSDDFANDQNNGDLTLREAIRIVNGDYILPPGSTTDDAAQVLLHDGQGNPTPLGTNDKIVFDDSVFGTAQGQEDTIELLHGELLITNSVVIDGADGFGMDDGADDLGWSGLTIDAGTLARAR